MVGMQVGIGYDVHPLVEGRELILGGVTIPHPRGLSGHTDGDVLTHAIIDALLGAAGQGDIGTHFPSSDETYKGASSLELLAKVVSMLAGLGWRLGNLDATIVAQQPRLSPFTKQMAARVAEALSLDLGRVNVKATSTDGLGFPGREEGIAAYAIALIEEGE
ncbi:MAG: 2-C-methyl-D-erythritol 2,4-cyclodiphosphate synthase [Dehalococcoidia bacterium]